MQYQARYSRVGIVGIPYSEHVLTLLVTSGMYVPTCRYLLSFPLEPPFSFLISLGREGDQKEVTNNGRFW